MPEIKYKTISISARFGAHLRDYKYSIADGKHTVQADSKIGSKLQHGSKVNVIDPITYSEDKKWIQVIDENGVTGFIRASHVDVAKLNAQPSKSLDKPLNYFHTQSDRIVYEASKGIRRYDPEVVQAAADDVSMRKEVYPRIDTLLTNYLAEHSKEVTFDMLCEGSKLGNNYQLFNAFKNQLPEIRYKDKVIKLDNDFLKAYFQNRKRSMDCIDFAKDMKEQDVSVEYDMVTGCLEGDFTYRDLGQYDFTKELLPIAYSRDLRERYDVADVDLVAYDRGTFLHGNRAYAEKSATERMVFKARMEQKEANTKFDIPEELTHADTAEQLKRDISDFANNPSSLFTHQKQKHNGFLLAENHSGTETRTWLKNNMRAMKQAGIHTLYSEHLFGGLDQKQVDRYLETGKMSRTLKKCLSKPNMAGFKEILEEAKACEMRVVGIGNSLAQTDTAIGDGVYTRALLFNQCAAAAIEKDQKNLGDNQKGFVVLAGTAHLCMHEGMVQKTAGGEEKRQAPIRGLSQLLKMQVLSINKENDIEVESKKIALVGDKDGRVTIDMEEYCKEKGYEMKQPVRMNFKQLAGAKAPRNTARQHDFLGRTRNVGEKQPDKQPEINPTRK